LQLIRHGASLAPIFDPDTVTQIITDSLNRTVVLKTLGLKKMSNIPDHIPTVTWAWASAGMGMAKWSREQREAKFREDYWKHGAFSERLEAGMDLPKTTKPRNKSGKDNDKGKAAIIDVDASHSHIS
jgi:DNA polymerase lambda